MADLPMLLAAPLSERLTRVLDVEGKIPRAFDALGSVRGTDAILIDGAGDLRAQQLRDLGARVTRASPANLSKLAHASADVVVSCWSWFREDLPAEFKAADSLLRPGGRLLVLHDYGRDDVSRLRQADLPEYTAWSRRDGWFLKSGFKVRVIHCWWTFDTVEDGANFLDQAFGDVGREVGSGLRRPRLSYNVAIYHWTKGEAVSG